MMTTSSSPMAMILLDRFHFGHPGRGGAGYVLLLIGIAFAGLLVWAIQRSGRTTN
ncbi:MAG TPA: hypothetical protein VHZ52_06410 [Acidobacteriaceae bacterium]|nr:hypothetical protein [Acidobacteriaceae bacterium]